MANGEYTKEDALLSDEKFRQYVVVKLELLSMRMEQHEGWHKTVTKLAVAAPAAMLAGYALFKLAVATAGVAP